MPSTPTKKPIAKKPATVVERRVKTGDGTITLRTVDIASPTFGEDMLYVFRRNVAAARRENKRVIGVADVAPAKR